jgi:outer membrane immunogenic protein
MNHRLLALGSVAALALGVSGALAADIPARGPAIAPAPVIFAPAFTWSGFYVGVNAGHAGDKFRYPFGGDIGNTPYSGSASVTSSGFIGGGQIGYNYAFGGGFMLGVEADYQFANVDGSLNLALNNPISAAIEGGSELTSFGTVRGRIGYGWDRALIYATGGWAYGRVKSSGSIEFGGFSGGLSRSQSANGWTLGAGMEYALTNNLSFKTEYLYVDLGDKTLYAADYRFATARLDVDTRFHVVRAGLNWRFWSPTYAVAAPVLARY